MELAAPEVADQFFLTTWIFHFRVAFTSACAHQPTSIAAKQADTHFEKAGSE